MRRLVLRLTIVLALAGVAVAGAAGAYSYGQEYSVHRGFAALVPFRRAGTGRLLVVHFYSRALRRQADYYVYLPPHYGRQRGYPVYYLLHGSPGKPRVYVDIANMDVRLDNQLGLGRARPMILVYPDGRIGGSTFSDSEWANTQSGDFESYVLDVVRDVDHRFSTLARRQDRVIAGFSAGAYGAMNIALHHPAVFAGVQSWSGYFIQDRSGVFAHASRAELAYDSPLAFALADRYALAAHPLRIYMFVGRDDDSSRQQPVMVAALRAAGASVQSRLFPGGHDWSVWYPRLNAMLDLASWDFAHPPVVRRPVLAAPRPVASAPAHRFRHRRSELRLLGALLLALLSAALINFGFVLQHRGQHRSAALLGAFRERSWLLGQAVGWAGFAGQIVAVALAPLTLVQAFSAGSLALSVPLAARVFGQRVQRAQFVTIAVIAMCLLSLPIGFSGGHGPLRSGVLIGAALLAMLGGAASGALLGGLGRAIAAGALYGAGDAAIKADAVALRVHGMTGIVSTWTLLVALCTFAGFLCFQAALRDGDAVGPLSLMNAFTAITAVVLGIVAFGEPLGIGVFAGIVHALAIIGVLLCVRPLVGAQQRLIAFDAALGAGAGVRGPDGRRWPGLGRCLTAGAAGLVAFIVLLACVLVGMGLLYALRQQGWLAVGPHVSDALPLLQLAGSDGQPLLRVLAAWLAAGLLFGTLVPPLVKDRRLVYTAILAALLLLVASDATYALARNLRFDAVLLGRAPGLGAWVEALALTAGAALAGRMWARLGTPVSRPDVGVGMAVARARLTGAQPRVLAPVTMAVACATAAGVFAFALPGDHARAKSGLSPRRGAALVRSSPRPIAGPRAVQSISYHAAPHSLPKGRLLMVRFYSAALRREADYFVYLPAGYTGSERLPVFYLLHGMPGIPLAFTNNAHIEPKLEELIRAHLARPMILVFPDGRIRGNSQSDSEWANTPAAGRYEDYVLDVVHDVDHRFNTLARRQDRAIAGLSAGAYGALNIGLHHVAMFGLIQVWSGYCTQVASGVFAHATRAELEYNSPIDYVRRMRATLAAYPLHVFLYVGNHDPDRRQTPPMDAALRTEGADAAYAIYPGSHDWNLWTPRIDEMLMMASRLFSSAGAVGSRYGRGRVDCPRTHTGRERPGRRPAGRRWVSFKHVPMVTPPQCDGDAKRRGSRPRRSAMTTVHRADRSRPRVAERRVGDSE